MDGSDSQLTLDGGDERRSLEQSTSEGLESTRKLGFSSRKLIVKADNADIFFSCTLLRLDKTSGAVDAHDQAAGNFGVERATVAGFVDPVIRISSILNRINIVDTLPQYALNPGHDFMARGVGRLVEVDHTGANV